MNSIQGRSECPVPPTFQSPSVSAVFAFLSAFYGWPGLFSSGISMSLPMADLAVRLHNIASFLLLGEAYPFGSPHLQLCCEPSMVTNLIHSVSVSVCV